MSLNENREPIFFGSRQDRLYEKKDLVVIFNSPSYMNSQALVSAKRMFFRNGIRFSRHVDAVETAKGKRGAGRRRSIIGKLYSFEAIGDQLLITSETIEIGRKKGISRKIFEVIEIEINSKLRRLRGAIVKVV